MSNHDAELQILGTVRRALIKAHEREVKGSDMHEGYVNVIEIIKNVIETIKNVIEIIKQDIKEQVIAAWKLGGPET